MLVVPFIESSLVHIRDLDGVFGPLFSERHVSANNIGLAVMLILLILCLIKPTLIPPVRAVRSGKYVRRMRRVK